MGALHPGHVSLIQKALETCDRVVASIFVNPRQFNNPSDLALYPRNPESDKAILESVGCHYLYAPNESEVYENEDVQNWNFGALMSVMEGECRPRHFQGMLSVVHQLLRIIQPHHLFMGEKDFQQAALVRRLINSHHNNIQFHLVDTVREPDGLARSSRNVLLSPESRKLAQLIPSALKKLVALPNKETCIEAIIGVSKDLTAAGIQIDYLQLRNEDDLSEMVVGNEPCRYRVFFAGFVGGVRLIDNMSLPFCSGASQ
jgi:pantoate--beta-alanine ligase